MTGVKTAVPCNRIDFEKQQSYKIGRVTYLVTAHFDDAGNSLPVKIERLLRKEAG